MKNLPVYDISGLAGLKHNDVLVSSFAPYKRQHHHLKAPHGHSFYHLVLFTHGSGYHTIDFDRFYVKPFQMYFMIPGQVHHWNFEELVDGYVINFSLSFFQSFLLRTDYIEKFAFFQGAARDSVIDIPEAIRPKIISLFEEMLAIKLTGADRSADRLRILMLQVFFTVADVNVHKTDQQASSSGFRLLRKFQKLIEKNYAGLRLPKDYAGMLAVTPNHLNAVCSQILGLSAGDMIRNRIQLEAKRLLVNLELPISEIAYKLNFNDNSYFTKFFKKHAGVTPEEFRKQISKLQS